MKALLLTLLVGCAPQAMTTKAQHPANPDAPTGRLAGPPAALRPGVADVSTPARTTTPATATGTDHMGHGASEPAKTEPAKTEPDQTQPTPQKPTPTKPAEKPRKQDEPSASKKAPDKEPPKPTPPPAHQGHEGHH